MREYAGEHYIWTLNQAAMAAAKYPIYPATWTGLEALQARVAMSGEVLAGPRDLAWAQKAFADAQMRFNPTIEQVCA